MRFGNHVYYNEYSMRSKPITDTSFVILGLGDSVINGGVQSNNESIATTLLENEFRKIVSNSRVLNISAGSWGPDNNFAYIKKYGDFNAKLIFLVVSSHDAHDNITHEAIVDVHSSFPSKQPPFAIWELFDRYLIPWVQKLFKEKNEEIDKRTNDPIVTSKAFNPGFDSLKNYCITKKIPLVIYLHADTIELKAKSYNEQGREIIKYCNENNITLIKELDYPLKKEHFSDGIHMNTKEGQKFIAQNLFPILKEKLKFD